MLKRVFSSASILTLSATLLLTGCAHRTDVASDETGTFKNTAACSNNQFLQRYGCSLDRVEQAAESNDPDAMYALGYMYYYGIGTVRDKDTAVVWIQRAAGLNQPLAIKAMEMIYHTSFKRQGRATMAAMKDDHTGLPNLDPKVSDIKTGHQQFSSNKVKTAIPDQINMAKHIKPAANTKSSSTVAKASSANKPSLSTMAVKAKSETAAQPVVASHGDSNWAGASAPVSGVVASHTAESITEQGKKHYTLQIMAAHHMDVIKDFLTSHHLGAKASYYHTYFQNKNWYVLIYGDYPSVKMAKQAINELPHSVQGMHPWVKSYRTVQKEILQKRVI